MGKLLTSAAIATSLLASSTPSLAAEKTITLAVENMYCADCPFIVRKSLEAVPGVSKAVVSYKDKTAVVTDDDSKANVAGASSPRSSWTRDSWSTPDCRHGPSLAPEHALMRVPQSVTSEICHTRWRHIGL